MQYGNSKKRTRLRLAISLLLLLTVMCVLTGCAAITYNNMSGPPLGSEEAAGSGVSGQPKPGDADDFAQNVPSGERVYRTLMNITGSYEDGGDQVTDDIMESEINTGEASCDIPNENADAKALRELSVAVDAPDDAKSVEGVLWQDDGSGGKRSYPCTATKNSDGTWQLTWTTGPNDDDPKLQLGFTDIEIYVDSDTPTYVVANDAKATPSAAQLPENTPAAVSAVDPAPAVDPVPVEPAPAAVDTAPAAADPAPAVDPVPVEPAPAVENPAPAAVEAAPAPAEQPTALG